MSMADRFNNGIAAATINVPAFDTPESKTLAASFTSTADRLTKAFMAPISEEVINRPAMW